MTIFKNLFVCNGHNEEPKCDACREIDELKKSYSELRAEVEYVKQDIKQLYRDNNDIKTDIKALEVKLENRFDILTSKLDSVLLLLKNK